MQPLSNVQKPEFVSVRDAFAHEAHGFTRWLEANIDTLSSRIGIELTVLEREKAVGSFNVDLFCETSDGRYAIVENQLERSDHDHLGKVLTYLVNLEAKTGIWVTPEVRPEHQRVIDWLNESTSADYAFYLVRVEAIRTGNFTYIPIFTLLAAPDEQIREIGETKKELADRQYQYKEFWTQLLEKSKHRANLYSGRSPLPRQDLRTGAGRTGFDFSYVIFPDYAWVELYIDIDKDDPQKNKAIFDTLHAQKEAIESESGEPLEWHRLDNRRASRVVKRIVEYGGLTSPENWSQLQDEMINTMIKFDQVFRPKIRNL